MNRRSFFTRLASGLVIATCPQIFIPKTFAPVWRSLNPMPVFSYDFEHFIGPVIMGMIETVNMNYWPIEDFGPLDESLIIPMDLYLGPKIRREEQEKLL